MVRINTTPDGIYGHPILITRTPSFRIEPSCKSAIHINDNYKDLRFKYNRLSRSKKDITDIKSEAYAISVMNAILTNGRAVFAMTRDSLRSIIKGDRNLPKSLDTGFSNDQYRLILSDISSILDLELDILKEKRPLKVTVKNADILDLLDLDDYEIEQQDKQTSSFISDDSDGAASLYIKNQPNLILNIPNKKGEPTVEVNKNIDLLEDTLRYSVANYSSNNEEINKKSILTDEYYDDDEIPVLYKDPWEIPEHLKTQATVPFDIDTKGYDISVFDSKSKYEQDWYELYDINLGTIMRPPEKRYFSEKEFYSNEENVNYVKERTLKYISGRIIPKLRDSLFSDKYTNSYEVIEEAMSLTSGAGIDYRKLLISEIDRRFDPKDTDYKFSAIRKGYLHQIESAYERNIKKHEVDSKAIKSHRYSTKAALIAEAINDANRIYNEFINPPPDLVEKERKRLELEEKNKNEPKSATKDKNGEWDIYKLFGDIK